MLGIRALEFGLEVGMDRSIVEGHSEFVVKALINEESDLASYGLLILNDRIRDSCYSKFSYSHTKGDSNKVAHHSLARLTIDFLNYTVWMENVLPQVYSIFQVDLAILP